MLNVLKQNKAITLIALIITIIVLLILAGVTISAITSNESAMEKAVEAKEKNNQGVEFDAIKVAAVSSVAEGNHDLNIDLETLRTSLASLVTETNLETIITGEGPWTVTGKTGKKYLITNDGDVKSYTATKITVNNEEVELSIDNFSSYIGTTVATIGGVNYGLFYVDFEGKYSGEEAGTVFLRAKGNLSTKTTLNTALSADDQAVAVPIMKQLNQDWAKGNRGNTEYSSMQSNEKGAVYLCNPNNPLWAGTETKNDFEQKYGAGNVNYIIGAPSVELFFASYNEKYNSVYSATYRPADKTYPGYLYSNNGGTSYNEAYYTKDAIKYSDEGMYKPSSGNTWLASPLSFNYDGTACLVSSLRYVAQRRMERQQWCYASSFSKIWS